MNIIINSDDFGISESANQAIVALHKKGVLSSASLMVDMPCAEAAAAIAKKQNIPVGLHFNLTVGPSAKYKGRLDFERSLMFGQVRIRSLKKELMRQYEKFLSFGLTPTHLDTHQHIHNWPLIFPVFARFAKKHKIPIRLILEKPIFNKYDKPKLSDLKHLIRKMFLLACGYLNLITAKLLRVKTNRSLTSVFALLPCPVQLEHKHLRLILQNWRSNTEYMCHPITNVENTPTNTTEISLREYNLMTNPEFFAMLNNRYNLINFGGL